MDIPPQLLFAKMFVQTIIIKVLKSSSSLETCISSKRLAEKNI